MSFYSNIIQPFDLAVNGNDPAVLAQTGETPRIHAYDGWGAV